MGTENEIKIMEQLLVHNVLSTTKEEQKKIFGNNSKVRTNWFKLFGAEERSSEESLILSKFHEFSKKSDLEIHAAPTSTAKPSLRAPHSEISSDIKTGQAFMSQAGKVVQNVLPTVNGPNSPIHILDDGRVLLVALDPEIIFEISLQSETDFYHTVIFHVFRRAQPKGPFTWRKLADQLFKLGYVENITGIKCTLFNTLGQEKVVTCLVLTPPAVELALGKNKLSDLPASNYIIPTTSQLTPELVKEKKKTLAEIASSEG